MFFVRRGIQRDGVGVGVLTVCREEYLGSSALMGLVEGG